MPFASRAQQGKLAIMMKQGKFPKAKFDEFAKATDFSKLPARVSGMQKARLNMMSTTPKKKKKKKVKESTEAY